MALFALLLFGFVVPTFAELLAQLKIALPWVTRLIMGIGEFVYAHWLAIVTTPILLVAGYFSARQKYYPFARWCDQQKLRIPIIGEILTMVAMSRLAHNMAMLMKAGVALQRSLYLSRAVVGNLAVAEAIKDAELAVNDGQSMSEAFRHHRCFSPIVLRMIMVGEETGTLANAFVNVSTRFDKEIPRRVKRFLSVLEPSMVIFLIVLVGTVALAIFLPFLDLMGGIL